MARDEKRTIGDALYELLHPFEARDRRLAEEERARRSREEYGERKERQTAAELAKLSNRGCYYVFNDLPTLHAGNIDHLVVGPEGVTLVETKGNSGIVEARPAGDGELSLTVDGKPLHRNISNQVRSQMWDLCERAGMDSGPDETKGMNWLVCFPAGTIGQGIPPKVRAHIATTADLLMKLRAHEYGADDEMVHAMASAVSSLYEKPPSARPARPSPRREPWRRE